MGIRAAKRLKSAVRRLAYRVVHAVLPATVRTRLRSALGGPSRFDERRLAEKEAYVHAKDERRRKKEDEAERRDAPEVALGLVRPVPRVQGDGALAPAARSGAPRAVIAAPLFDKAEYLPLALDSLLMQRFRDFALLLVDDCSSDDTQAVAEQYASDDPRVAYYRNTERLGMIANKRRCFSLARELYPGSEYFAWGTDHDVWYPGWLEELSAALDAAPEAVLAYPQSIRIDEGGEIVRLPWAFDTAGETDARRRFRLTYRHANAGSMVYGLYRAEALERAGVFRFVLNPDRLLMYELALQGRFVQVPRILWERRFRGLASHKRQRAAFFPKGAPLSSRLPTFLTHAGVLFSAYVLHGRESALRTRGQGLLITLDFLWLTLRAFVRRRAIRSYKAVATRYRAVVRWWVTRKKDRRRRKKEARLAARSETQIEREPAGRR